MLIHPVLLTNHCVSLYTAVYLSSKALFAGSLKVCFSMPVIVLNQNKVRQISYFSFICSAGMVLQSNLNEEFVWECCADISESSEY